MAFRVGAQLGRDREAAGRQPPSLPWTCATTGKARGPTSTLPGDGRRSGRGDRRAPGRTGPFHGRQGRHGAGADHPEMVNRLVVADIAPVAYGHTRRIRGGDASARPVRDRHAGGRGPGARRRGGGRGREGLPPPIVRCAGEALAAEPRRARPRDAEYPSFPTCRAVRRSGPVPVRREFALCDTRTPGPHPGAFPRRALREIPARAIGSTPRSRANSRRQWPRSSASGRLRHPADEAGLLTAMCRITAPRWARIRNRSAARSAPWVSPMNWNGIPQASAPVIGSARRRV